MTNSLQDHVRAELLRHIVGRQITCIRTGEVLDVWTCVVVLDSDGDPSTVLSQKGWREVATDGTAEKLTTMGYAVDPLTVRYESGERVLVDGEHLATIVLHSRAHPDVVRILVDGNTDTQIVHPRRLTLSEV